MYLAALERTNNLRVWYRIKQLGMRIKFHRKIGTKGPGRFKRRTHRKKKPWKGKYPKMSHYHVWMPHPNRTYKPG